VSSSATIVAGLFDEYAAMNTIAVRMTVSVAFIFVLVLF
jgi:hypothetical protein